MNALAIPLATINFLRTGELGNYKVKGLPTFDQLKAANPSTNRPVSTQQAEGMFGGTKVSGAPTGFSGGGGGGGGGGTSGGGTTPAKVTGATPEPVFTDMGQALASDFSQTGIGGIQGLGDIIFNINGGDPNAVVDALRDFMRNNGSVPIVTAGIY